MSATRDRLNMNALESIHLMRSRSVISIPMTELASLVFAPHKKLPGGSYGTSMQTSSRNTDDLQNKKHDSRTRNLQKLNFNGLLDADTNFLSDPKVRTSARAVQRKHSFSARTLRRQWIDGGKLVLLGKQATFNSCVCER